MNMSKKADQPLIDVRDNAGKQRDNDADSQADVPNQTALIIDDGNPANNEERHTDCNDRAGNEAGAQVASLEPQKKSISCHSCCSIKAQFRIGAEIVMGITIIVLVAILATSSKRETGQQVDVHDRSRTSASSNFTFSICFNGAMQDVCNSGSLNNSSIRLICDLLTLSTSIDLSVASKGKDYWQLCKKETFNEPGAKGMKYVCHTCLGYNSSDRDTSDHISVLPDTECFFEPAINKHNYSYDGTSAFLALRSNDPERWAKSSHFMSTDLWKRLTGSGLSGKYREKRSKVEPDFVQPICSTHRQCSDIVDLHVDIHAVENEGPPDCSLEEVRSWAYKKDCTSTKEWLSRWLYCCPK